MTAGDTIMFRGSRRFVVLNKPGGLVLERIRSSRFAGQAFYTVSETEKAAVRVVRRGTRRDVLRARRLYSRGWCRVAWGPDGQPIHLHDGSPLR